MENVILVDREDNPIGSMEKMEAHEKGILHRAFSVFIFNEKNQLLMQRRAFDKYHSGGLWTNTCCSHPRVDEDIIAAGKRRLEEEMGFSTEVVPIFSFIYKARLDNDMTEHELDHILVGKYNQPPAPNQNEVCDWKFMDLNFLEEDLKANTDRYTVWFLEIFERVKNHILNQNESDESEL